MITLNLAKQFNVFLPKPFKYIQKEYLDMFFDSGILRISSFNRFRNYPDEIRGDLKEGSGVYMGHDPDKRIQFIVQTDDYENSYMLSTSMFLDEGIMAKFNCDGCFQIMDPLNFSIAISNSIPGFLQSLQGFCNYHDERLIATEFDSVDDLMFRNQKGDFVIGDANWREKVGKIAQTGFEKLFIKENKYREQAEYRFVWLIDSAHHEMYDYMDLNCREAVKFCRAIKL